MNIVSTQSEPPVTEHGTRAQKTYAAAAGLTGPGVYVIVFALSLVGLIVDVFTGGGIGPLFAIVFVAACAYAAWSVRLGDRAAAVTAPPLVFAALMLMHNLAQGSGALLDRLLNTANALLSHGPALWTGTAVAAALVLFRSWVAKRSPN